MTDDFHAPGDVPNVFIVIRGGQVNLPPPGNMFSASAGPTLEDAATGIPHGTIRVASAAAIRAKGGTILVRPERARSGTMNWRHVNVIEGAGPSVFGPPIPNPVPKDRRIR